MANGFEKAYSEYSKKYNMNPNPDDPRHYYDYRALHKETGGINPDKSGHLPSKYKLEGHPRMIVDGVNTKTGLKVDKEFYGHPIPPGRESKMDSFSKHKVAQTLF